MSYIFLIISIIMAVVLNYLNKKNSIIITETKQFVLYNASIMAMSCSLSLIIISINKTPIILNTMTIIISLLSAISLCGGMLSSFWALKKGAVVLVNVFCASGILIPCIGGFLLFGEQFTLLQLGGIFLLIGSLYLLFGYNSSIKGKLSLKGLILVILSMLFNGLQMLSLKMYTYYVPKGNISFFLFLAFGGASILTLLFLASLKIIKVKTEGKQKFSPQLIIYAGATAALMLGANYFLTLAGVNIPTIIVYPFYSGFSLIFLAILSAFVFNEKLMIKSIGGLTIGIVALILINLTV